jgi:hypothetical protein
MVWASCSMCFVLYLSCVSLGCFVLDVESILCAVRESTDVQLLYLAGLKCCSGKLLCTR